MELYAHPKYAWVNPQRDTVHVEVESILALNGSFWELFIRLLHSSCRDGLDAIEILEIREFYWDEDVKFSLIDNGALVEFRNLKELRLVGWNNKHLPTVFNTGAACRMAAELSVFLESPDPLIQTVYVLPWYRRSTDALQRALSHWLEDGQWWTAAP